MPTDWERLVEELIKKTPPKTLCHYTTNDGLLSIINSGEFWATNLRYMNDTKEFIVAIGLAVEYLKSLRYKHRAEEDKLAHLAIQRLNSITNVDVCAVSFCENNDLLSQWRGYSGSSGGVCIGFRSTALITSAETVSGQLAPCIYDESMQNRVICEVFNLSMKELASSRSRNQETISAFAEIFVQRLITYAALFKDIGFQEEAEWRLVTGFSKNPADYEYRVRKSMVIPYLKVGLRGTHWDGEISSATVGPCAHPDAALRATRGLFVKHGIANRTSPDNVTLSKIPYRYW